MINKIKIIGTIKEILPSFEANNIKFNQIKLKTTRLSENSDTILIIFKDGLINNYSVGSKLYISGDIRTKNMKENNKSKLLIYVYAITADFTTASDMNSVELEGYICKPVIKRITPLHRNICDILVAYNSKRASYYIPVIAFGDNANKISKLSVGDLVNITGRLQSRNYTKVLEDGSTEERTAYEVAVSTIISNELGDLDINMFDN